MFLFKKEDNIITMNTWVKLNVGGTKFETTIGTLTSSPGSLLARMFDPFSGRPLAAVGKDGCYLIDACPRAFSVILNWLRYKEILSKEIDPEDVIPVADCFGLTELYEQLHYRALKTHNNKGIIRLNVGGTIFETTRKTMTSRPGKTRQNLSRFPTTADGAYFIDACPKAAEIILNWIRRYPNCSNSFIIPNPPAGLSEADLCFAAECFGLNCRVNNRDNEYEIEFLFD